MVGEQVQILNLLVGWSLKVYKHATLKLNVAMKVLYFKKAWPEVQQRVSITLSSNVTEFQKINHFVIFDTLNISSPNKALNNTNQYCFKHTISHYHELREILRNILRTACVLLHVY